MANFPNRCQHLKINGTQCGSPALRRNRFCFFHKRFHDERIRLSADRKRRGVATFILPVLEDANSIQIALMQVMRLVISQQIENKTASLLLYALQTASTNLRMTDFKPGHHEVILDPRDAVNNPVGEHFLWSDDDFDDEEEEEAEEEKPFDVDAYMLEKRRKRQEEQDRKDLKTINYFRKWSEDHSGSKLVCDEYGHLKIVPAEEPASPASPATTSTHSKPQPESSSTAPAAIPAQPASNSSATALPEKKKPAAEKTIAEVRQELVNMIRNSGLPEMYGIPDPHKEKKTT